MKIRTLFRRLKKLPAALRILLYLLTLTAAAGTILLLIAGKDETPWAPLLYAVAALLLTLSVYVAAGRLAAIRKKLRAAAQKKLPEERRRVLFPGFAALVNLANTGWNAAVALLSSSLWYGALAGYYLSLTLLRIGLVRSYRKVKRGESDPQKIDSEKTALREYHKTGALLLLLSLFLAIAIGEMILSDQSFRYPGLTIYASAAYSFYKIIAAILFAFRARKGNDLLLKALRNTNLADAMVSILALQTALLNRFSNGEDSGPYNLITGVAVLLITVALGLFMLLVRPKKAREEQPFQ